MTVLHKSMAVYAWCGDTYVIRPKSPLLTRAMRNKRHHVTVISEILLNLHI